MMLHPPLNHSIGGDSGTLTAFSSFALSATAYSQAKQLRMLLLILMSEGEIKKGEMRDGRKGEVGPRQKETVSAA